jgi:outer membrane protein
MRQPARSILLTLLACSLSSASFAAEAAPDKQPSLPAPQQPTPQALPAAGEKPAAPAVTQQGTKLGQVDVARVASESETAKTGQAQLGELKKKLQGQIETKRKQLEKQKVALEEKLKMSTPQQREAKAKEFQKKVEEFQKFGMNAEKELQAKSEEFSEKLFKAIEQASAELGKAKDLALVVIKRELLFLNNGVDTQDVTEDVIRKIDKK